MQVTKQTKALAEDILAYWAKTKVHDQHEWFEDRYALDNLGPVIVLKHSAKPVCNTTMCAAGTAVFLSTSIDGFKKILADYGRSDSEWVEHGATLLGLDEREAEKLFYSSDKSARILMNAIARGSNRKFDNHAFGDDYMSLDD